MSSRFIKRKEVITRHPRRFLSGRSAVGMICVPIDADLPFFLKSLSAHEFLQDIISYDITGFSEDTHWYPLDLFNFFGNKCKKSYIPTDNRGEQVLFTQDTTRAKAPHHYINETKILAKHEALALKSMNDYLKRHCQKKMSPQKLKQDELTRSWDGIHNTIMRNYGQFKDDKDKKAFVGMLGNMLINSYANAKDQIKMKKKKKGKSTSFDLPQKPEFSKNVRIAQKHVDFITKAIPNKIFIGKGNSFFDKQKVVADTKKIEAAKMKEEEEKKKLLTQVSSSTDDDDDDEDDEDDEDQFELPRDSKKRQKPRNDSDDDSSNDDNNTSKKPKTS